MTFLPCLMLALAAPAAEPHEANPLYQELRTKGVAVKGRENVVLPAPYMADGLTADAQKAVLDQVCVGPDPKRPLFHLKDVLAPRNQIGAALHHYERNAVEKTDPKRPAFMIHVWFIAYGDVAGLAKKDPNQLFGANPQEATVTPLEKEELAERKIALDLKPPLRESYVNSEADLLNRVHISLTSHAVMSPSADSLLVASRVDPRFNQDPKYPNYWQMLPEKKGAAPGPKQPADEGAFYLKITKLAAPEGALFVEFHQVSTEPKEWFGSSSVLAGKIPLWVKTEVGNFRRTADKTLPAKP